MNKLKLWLKSKVGQIKNWVSSTLLPKLEIASTPVKIVGYLAVGVVMFALFIAIVSAIAFFMILLPGMFVGLFAWLAWTYFGLGATYFAMLDPIYLHIPYWHFAWGFAVLIFIIRAFRKKGYGNQTPNDTNGNQRSQRRPIRT